MVDYAEAGAMPVLAGTRDQSHAFMEARRYFLAREAEARQERRRQQPRHSDG